MKLEHIQYFMLTKEQQCEKVSQLRGQLKSCQSFLGLTYQSTDCVLDIWIKKQEKQDDLKIYQARFK